MPNYWSHLEPHFSLVTVGINRDLVTSQSPYQSCKRHHAAIVVTVKFGFVSDSLDLFTPTWMRRCTGESRVEFFGFWSDCRLHGQGLNYFRSALILGVRDGRPFRTCRPVAAAWGKVPGVRAKLCNYPQINCAHDPFDRAIYAIPNKSLAVSERHALSLSK